MSQYALHLGDCLESMRSMAENSVDSIVTDPPYEIGFMGKKWDSTGIANNVELWREALRVLKPGGHLLSFSGARTYHRMTCAIEDAGFDIRDQIMWVYGSGFPKSLNIGKAIDGYITNGKSDSLSLKVVNETRPGEAHIRPTSTNGHRGIVGSADAGQSVKRNTPATPEGEQWDGWGTALKPAHEPICVARKPFSGTVANNILAHGTGAMNIDGCRVAGESTKRDNHGGTGDPTQLRTGNGDDFTSGSDAGRWPANLIHDGSDEVLASFPNAKGQQGAISGNEPSNKTNGIYGAFSGRNEAAPRDDTGSAARFFYCAKTSRKDRHEGMQSPGAQFSHGSTLRKVENTETVGNNHPTVKPTDLMRYLCRLVTPPGGTVLDPFMGSGSTGKAAMREGFKFIGCEMSEEYMRIAEARIIAAIEPPDQTELFSA